MSVIKNSYGKVLMTLLVLLLLSACGTTMKKTEVESEEARLARQQQMEEQDFQQALAALQAGEYTQAKRRFTAMTEQYPTLAGPYLNLGLLQLRDNQPEAAEQLFRQAVEVNPNSAAGLNQLGILLRQRGAFDEAHDMYQKALQADPDHANSHLNLAILYDLYMGRPMEAMVHYQRFQTLSGGGDEQVAIWISELKLRLPTGEQVAGGEN